MQQGKKKSRWWGDVHVSVSAQGGGGVQDVTVRLSHLVNNDLDPEYTNFTEGITDDYGHVTLPVRVQLRTLGADEVQDAKYYYPPPLGGDFALIGDVVDCDNLAREDIVSGYAHDATMLGTGAIGPKLFTFFGGRSARGLPPG